MSITLSTHAMRHRVSLTGGRRTARCDIPRRIRCMEYDTATQWEIRRDMVQQLEPIGRTSESLSDVAYERISNAMLTGALAPGDRLVMDQLAEQLDISRTPVRDALLRLEQERLIEPAGRRGYVVTMITDQDVARIYETREAIEGYSARRVAELGPRAIDVVARALDALPPEGPADAEMAFRANLRVHRAVVEATDNALLLTMFDNVWQRARGMATFATYVEHVTLAHSTRDEHLPLLDALREGPDQAFAAMRAHIRAGRSSYTG